MEVNYFLHIKQLSNIFFTFFMQTKFIMYPFNAYYAGEWKICAITIKDSRRQIFLII